MKNPNYAAQIISTMTAHNESPGYMLGYFKQLVTAFQRDAEAGDLTPKRLLEDLALACEVTTDLYNRRSNQP
jgi:hypothetical protein